MHLMLQEIAVDIGGKYELPRYKYLNYKSSLTYDKIMSQ